VLLVLTARGIDVPDHVRTRITSCTDQTQLDTWLKRAATATSIDELFVGTVTTKREIVDQSCG
jgi:hypothetical protein